MGLHKNRAGDCPPEPYGTDVARMLLARVMLCDAFSKTGIFRASLTCGLGIIMLVVIMLAVIILAVSSAASAQSGAITGQNTSGRIESAAMADRPVALRQVAGQPHLQEHLDRINLFRRLLREPGSGSRPESGVENDLAMRAAMTTPVIPRSRITRSGASRSGIGAAAWANDPGDDPGDEPGDDRINGRSNDQSNDQSRDMTNDAAILELEMSISARTGPSMIYPGVGLVVALQEISNWSNRNMIEALRAGGVPIYSARGHLIGVEDPASGRLLGGRRS